MKMTKAMLTAVLLCSSINWVSAPAFAEEAQPSFDLENVVVTASRTEQKVFDTQANVTVVTREDLDKKHYTDLGDVLKDVPGVNLQNYGASGENYTSNRLYINGSQNIVVLLDGMRINVNGSVFSVLSPSEFSNLDNIERIEVLKGSASTLYGSDAVGGVINIITRKAKENGVKTTLTAIAGSYDKQQYRIQNRGREGNIYWMASYQKHKMNDYKDGHGNKVIHEVDSDTYDVQLGADLKKGNVEFKYNKYKSDYIRPANGGLHETNQNLGKKNNDKISLQWRADFTENLSNQLMLYRNNTNLNDHYEDPANVWFMDLSTLGVTDQITWKTANNTLVAGFDFYEDRVDNYSSTSYGMTDAYQNKHLINRAFFFQDDYKLGKFNITPGIRYTKTSMFGSNTSKSISVGYNNGKTNAYAGYKEFFVAPNQYQLYSKYGGPNLKPSEGRTLELGVNQQLDDTCMATFNIYKTKADNIIAFDSATYKYNNIANEVTYGWSLGIKKNFSDKFNAYVNYTNTRIPAESSQKYENRDGYIPKGEYNIGLDYTLNKFNANLTTRGLIHRPGRKANADKVADNLKTFWTADVAMNYAPTKNLRVFAKVNNLFDKFYTDQMYDMRPEGSWYSAPGRNFQVGVEYKF